MSGHHSSAISARLRCSSFFLRCFIWFVTKISPHGCGFSIFIRYIMARTNSDCRTVSASSKSTRDMILMKNTVMRLGKRTWLRMPRTSACLHSHFASSYNTNRLVSSSNCGFCSPSYTCQASCSTNMLTCGIDSSAVSADVLSRRSFSCWNLSSLRIADWIS